LLRFALQFFQIIKAALFVPQLFKRVYPNFALRPARQNRKMLANPTRQHFSANFKRHKNKSGTKTPAPRPSKALRLSAL